MQVLDGILCHNGEADDVKISPEPCHTWPEFDKKVQDNAEGRRTKAPMTLEGCVVKFADTIAYIGRDLQDAREIGLIDASVRLPADSREVLGDTNQEIINTLIYDLLRNSDTEDSGHISYSPDVEAALISLRTFSRIYIYENRKLTSEREKVKQMYATLFMTCLNDLENEAKDAKIFTDFIDSTWISRNYLRSATFAELARDFIAGMTDRYFAKRYEECVIPRKIEGKFL
jgi:dGTPase